MFEYKVMTSPLHGKRIVVTRTREQASTMSKKLRARDAVPIEFPTIRIVPPSDWAQLDSALRHLCSSTGYDWVVFTSTNGVTLCLDRLQELGYAPEAARRARIAAIGPATAAALQQYGIVADLVPQEYVAERVAEALIADAQQRGASLHGKRILLARAAEARKVLFTLLRDAGAAVEEVAAYYTLPISHDDAQGRYVVSLLQQEQLDVITFTSSSTVRNFVAWLDSSAREGALFDLVNQRVVVACIGPITAQTARELGLRVDVVADVFTIDGLINALVAYYS
ncbi:MAG TPA: uroporphyrinogen-III synthase [Ktedonobacteraceae bacterium]|jgi:uroporphyrinogen-III synthase